MLAIRTGRLLHELLGWPGPITARQYDAIEEYEHQQWNRPDRHDWYLMRVAQLLMKDAPALPGMVLPFKDRTDEEVAEETPEQKKDRVAAEAKQRAIGRLGRRGYRVRTVDKDGNLIHEEKVGGDE